MARAKKQEGCIKWVESAMQTDHTIVIKKTSGHKALLSAVKRLLRR